MRNLDHSQGPATPRRPLDARRSSSVSSSFPRGFGAAVRFVANLHDRTVLARVGNWVIATYGPVMGITFALGFGAAAWYDLATGQDPTTKLAYYAFFIVPSILLGCRVASILLDYKDLFRRPLATILKPGYMLQGGIFGAIAALAVMAWWTDTRFLLLLDSGAFAMPLGEALGRLGCHLYGCCWGRPTGGRVGVCYTNPQAKVLRCSPHLAGVRLHAAPLYATIAYTIMFAGFCTILPMVEFDGLIAGLYLCLHPPVRVLLERFRDDDRGRLVGRWTHTNLYSLFMFVGGLSAIGYGRWSAEQFGFGSSLTAIDSAFSGLLASTTLGWLAIIGVMAFVAFGLHYRQVGMWIGSHDVAAGTEAGGQAN